VRIIHILGTVAAAALVVPLTAVAPPTSYAAGETCDGLPATIVISSAPDPEEFGTTGDDVVDITTSDVLTFDALGGDDTVCAGPGTTDVIGGDGNDTIDLSALTQNGRAEGDSGDDTVIGSAHGDVIFGGDGNDTLSGGRGNDTISGDAGDDLVMGGAGDDSVSGGSIGGGGASVSDTDMVQGGGGDDLVYDTASNESLVGGSGTDTLTLRTQDENDPEVCGGAPATTPKPVVSVVHQTVTGLGADTFSGFEAYQGGPYHDTLIGGPGPDHFQDNYCGVAQLLGEGGDDTLISDSCDARVDGGPGNDVLSFDSDGTGRFRGGPGNDRMLFARGVDYACPDSTEFGSGPSARAAEGGRGNNWLVLEPSAIRVVHRVDLFRRIVDAGPHHSARLTDIQNVRQQSDPRLSGGHLRIVGTAGPNILIGGPGPTLIFGRQGNDVLRGGAGHDTVYGGTGHDRCRAEVRHECEAH
jgi:Ca2+-binding RTX toxin-like protein